MINQITDSLFSIKINLPNSPLRDLNAYVIKTPAENLLIDTGFNLKACLEDMRQGIGELGLDMKKTNILTTHLHADHSGLINTLISPECKVFVGEIDRPFLLGGKKSDDYWEVIKRHYEREGFPMDEMDRAIRTNPAKALTSERPEKLIGLKDNEILTVGNVELECIHTPGHTPGHMCFYNKADKFMILGDHVLFDISPNITNWPSMKNALKSYMESLKKIQNYDVRIPLPAHRGCDGLLNDRINQLLTHHEHRLLEVLNIVKDAPGSNGYTIAGRMSWKIKADSWDDFPLTQRWFAMGEALSHIKHLVELGEVKRHTSGNMATYR